MSFTEIVEDNVIYTNPVVTLFVIHNARVVQFSPPEWEIGMEQFVLRNGLVDCHVLKGCCLSCRVVKDKAIMVEVVEIIFVQWLMGVKNGVFSRRLLMHW